MGTAHSWRSIILRPAELDVQFHRAGGPGGQHRNKVETAVRIVHLPTGIVVTATESRSQSQNRAAAMDRLRRRLWERAQPVKPRVATRPSRGAREERLRTKKRRTERKALRRTPWTE